MEDKVKLSKKTIFWLPLSSSDLDATHMKALQSYGPSKGPYFRLLYLELAIRSADHGGYLRITEKVPFTDPSQLVPIVNLPRAIIEPGLNALRTLGLLKEMDDGSFYFPLVAEKWKGVTPAAKYMKEYRSSHQQNIDNDVEEKTNDKEVGTSNNVKQMLNKVEHTPTIREEQTREEQTREEQTPHNPPEDLQAHNCDRFIKAYPKKTGRAPILKWFTENNPGDDVVDLIVSGIDLYMETKEWMKESGRFIKSPITYLENHLWELDPRTEEEKERSRERKLALEGQKALAEEVARQKELHDKIREGAPEIDDISIDAALNKITKKVKVD